MIGRSTISGAASKTWAKSKAIVNLSILREREREFGFFGVS